MVNFRFITVNIERTVKLYYGLNMHRAKTEPRPRR